MVKKQRKSKYIVNEWGEKELTIGARMKILKLK
jgi:hypothetical protein